MPPDDAIDLLQMYEGDDSIVGIYAWRGNPGVRAEMMVVTPAGELVQRLVIVYEQH
jgi:hypothetical protein